MFYLLMLVLYVFVVFIVPIKQSYLLKENQKKDTNPENQLYYFMMNIQIHHANLWWHIILSIIFFFSTISISRGMWLIGFITAILLITLAWIKHIYYWIQVARYRFLNDPIVQKNQTNLQDQPFDKLDRSFRFWAHVFIILLIIWIIFGIYVAIPDVGNDFAVMLFFIYSFLAIISFMISFRSSWTSVLLQILIFILISFFIMVMLWAWH